MTILLPITTLLTLLLAPAAAPPQPLWPADGAAPPPGLHLPHTTFGAGAGEPADSAMPSDSPATLPGTPPSDSPQAGARAETRPAGWALGAIAKAVQDLARWIVGLFQRPGPMAQAPAVPVNAPGPMAGGTVGIVGALDLARAPESRPGATPAAADGEPAPTPEAAPPADGEATRNPSADPTPPGLRSRATGTPLLNQHTEGGTYPWGYCGTTALRMALRLEGLTDPGADAVALSGSRPYLPGSGSDGGRLAARARELGLADARFGTSGSLRDVRQSIDRGKPVLVAGIGRFEGRFADGGARSRSYRSGHYMLVVDYETDPNGDLSAVVLNDPDSGRRLISTPSQFLHFFSPEGDGHIWTLRYDR